jgi:hypothetical protein
MEQPGRRLAETRGKDGMLWLRHARLMGEPFPDH